MSFLNKLMPELESMYFGQVLDTRKYPSLQNIVQTGFKSIRGVNMFKDMTVYASPQYSPYEIPENRPDDVVLEHF
jgi:hypothetical protein